MYNKLYYVAGVLALLTSSVSAKAENLKLSWTIERTDFADQYKAQLPDNEGTITYRYVKLNGAYISYDIQFNSPDIGCKVFVRASQYVSLDCQSPTTIIKLDNGEDPRTYNNIPNVTYMKFSK